MQSDPNGKISDLNFILTEFFHGFLEIQMGARTEL